MLTGPVHDPSDEVSEVISKASGTIGSKNGLVAPDAPTVSFNDEANGFEAIL
jgi:hypothetical protein